MKYLGSYICVLLLGWPSGVIGGVQEPLSVTASSPLIDLHKALVERPSITDSERNVTDFLVHYLRENGLTVETQPVSDNRQNVFAYLGTSRSTRVLVTSHVDTVPPFWPYERRGDEIWGRGTVDAKGSVASQIIAVQSLIELGQLEEGDVALLYVVGEERGGAGMKAANKLGLSWETVIFGEPTDLKLARGHKGVTGGTIRAKGIAGHSGYPEVGRNAIDILVLSLAALQTLELPWSERFGNTTINIGKIEGGVAANVIPEDAVATAAVRIAAGTPGEIQDLIRRTVTEVSPHVTVDFGVGIGPVPIDYDIEGFETFVARYGTDIPSLKGNHKRYLYGPGSIFVPHSDHEHLKISDLEAAVEGYKVLITKSLERST